MARKITAKGKQPDWHDIAEKFDLWLPHIAPVGEALLEALNARPGDRILDVASGTGEPALTLARRRKDVVITGTDAAAAMVDVAKRKVEKEQLSNIQFHCMPAEQLMLADATFDKVLCRFGVMLFENPYRGLCEMTRVLKPRGRVALAVWNTPSTMPTLCWAYRAFKGRVPPEAEPPLDVATSMSKPGVLEALMTEAGMRNIQIAPQAFHQEFDSFDSYWNLVEASGLMKAQFDALPAEQRNEVRDEIALLAKTCVAENRLVIPHEFLLATGGK